MFLGRGCQPKQLERVLSFLRDITAAHQATTSCRIVYTSQIHTSTLSQQRLLDQFGVIGQLSKRGLVLFKDNVPIIGGDIHNDLYHLDLSPINTQPQGMAIVMATGVSGQDLKPTNKGVGFCTT
jgi:hypothetical protein